MSQINAAKVATFASTWPSISWKKTGLRQSAFVPSGIHVEPLNRPLDSCALPEEREKIERANEIAGWHWPFLRLVLE
jgi:hypothetical protein